jgi:hypothetical protein
VSAHQAGSDDGRQPIFMLDLFLGRSMIGSVLALLTGW